LGHYLGVICSKKNENHTLNTSEKKWCRFLIVKKKKKDMYLANTLTNPGAVMVKTFNTIVANGAVRTPRRAV
jgi:hypothetical protein